MKRKTTGNSTCFSGNEHRKTSAGKTSVKRNTVIRLAGVLLSLLLLTAGCSPTSDADSSRTARSGSSAEEKDTGKAPEKSDIASTIKAADASESTSAPVPGSSASAADTPAASAAAATGSASTQDTTASAAAAGDSASSEAPSAQNSSEPAEPRKLKYIDAWDEWHTMEVDPGVEAIQYDPEKFLPSEENPQWITYTGDLECLQGIDVSEHQGIIDWQAVAAAGYRFAFIRTGFRGYGDAGTLVEDSMAVENLQKAKEAGLEVGAYFFSQALNEEEAEEEAALAVSVIERSGVELDLPLIYDPELIRDDHGRANEITREQVALNTAAFCRAVESSPACKADIYSNLPWEHHYFDTDTMNTYDIWYADYEPQPQTPYHFTWWQYTNEGKVPGIEGDVDLNLWLR